MSYQISDQSIFDISKVLYSQLLSEKNMKQLDKENLVQFKKKFIKPLYPHKEYTRNGQKIFQKYQCGQYCCEVNPGRFCCCSSKPPDPAYREFGLGICLYTKFIKHLSCFMFFVSILAILSIAAYQIVTLQTGIKATQNYQTALYSTTVGTLSAQFLKCSYQKFKLNQPLSFQLNCPIGQVVSKGPVHTDKSLSNLINCRLQKQKQIISSTIYSSAQYNSSPSTKEINLTFTSNNSNQEYISYNYQCVNSQLNVANNKIQLSKVIYFTVGIDLFIVVMFILFMISEHNAQEKQVQYFKSSQLAIHDFTVKVSGFHIGDYENELDNFIAGYNQLVNRNTQENFINNVVQIKVPQAQQLKKASQNRRDIYQQMYDHMYECFFQDEVDLYRYQNAQDFIKKCYGNPNSPAYQEYKNILTDLVSKFMQSKRIKYLEGDIDVSILMVLTNPKHKKQMIRRAKNQCFGNYIQIGRKKHQVSEPPVADLIIWENKYKFTCLRVVFAWIITLAIVLGSYMLIGFAQFKKQGLLSDSKFKIDCGILFTSSQMASWSQSLSSSKPSQYLHCYCYSNYFSLSTDMEMRSKCSQWLSKYIAFMGIPILISFGIVVYNLIVSRIFRLLSRFQAHENITSELYSYIIKRSFVLILNMGLIIILLKMQYSTTVNAADFSFLFSGQFPDLSSDWYMQIGVIIILTLSFNIALPLFDMIFVSFLKCLRRCWDRKCCCVKTSQKTKKGYIQLYANDIFPIEQRYSDLIALVIICMAFSAVMPILYVIMFLSIWFMFITDKLLLFRIYQKPINFNQNLQTNIFKIFYISVMIHCVVSPFILSQNNLTSLSTNLGNLDRFKTLLQTPYLLPYVILFLILAVWAVFYSTIVSALAYCIKKCQKQVSKIYKSKLHQNFFDALNQYQITKLMMSMQSQLHRNVQHQKSKKVSSHQIICQNTLRKLHEVEKKLAGNHKNEVNIRLIGKAGYEQMFDDDTFFRERKIKSLDYQFTQILKRENNIRNSSVIQETLAHIN